MDQEKPISHITAGLLIAAIVVGITFVLMLVSSNGPQGGWITYLANIAGLVYFIQRYAKANDNSLSFGELFSYGFKASTIITLLFIVFLIVVSLAYPQWKQTFIDASRLELEKQKALKEADIERTIQNIDKYYWIYVAGSVLFVFVFIGAVGSLIGAAISKKRPSQEQTRY